MQIPFLEGLPIHKLAACFNNTNSTYKYYWFLSIIQFVESEQFEIEKPDLFRRMLSNAWFTVNFFRVSFGSQDLIQSSIHRIQVIENLPIEGRIETIFEGLKSSSKKETEKLLWHFNKNVPHWFLSPWFPKKKMESDSAQTKRIYKDSLSPEFEALYALYSDKIVINPIWRQYLKSHSGILKDFCYWKLVIFLQLKNPNVPDIPNKLIKPAIRNSLSKHRKYWDLVFDELGFLNCIYTGEQLIKGQYAVEHFIPYNFISHDLIWNLIPANKKFNASKSDKLPILESHFDSFFLTHKRAIEIVLRKQSNNKFLEDYLTIFPDLSEVSTLPDHFLREKFKERIQPLITIASNNGFEFLTNS